MLHIFACGILSIVDAIAGVIATNPKLILYAERLQAGRKQMIRNGRRPHGAAHLSTDISS
jgi:hypothetical protein